MTKDELRTIVLDVIFGKVPVTYTPTQFVHLTIGVAETIRRRQGLQPTPHDPGVQLTPPECLVVNEIFWDLIAERVITPGVNASNLELPWFRLHSEAKTNLERTHS